MAASAAADHLPSQPLHAAAGPCHSAASPSLGSTAGRLCCGGTPGARPKRGQAQCWQPGHQRQQPRPPGQAACQAACPSGFRGRRCPRGRLSGGPTPNLPPLQPALPDLRAGISCAGAGAAHAARAWRRAPQRSCSSGLRVPCRAAATTRRGSPWTGTTSRRAADGTFARWVLRAWWVLRASLLPGLTDVWSRAAGRPAGVAPRWDAERKSEPCGGAMPCRCSITTAGRRTGPPDATCVTPSACSRQAGRRSAAVRPCKALACPARRLQRASCGA